MATAFLTAPVPHQEGAAAIANKPVLTRAVFDALAPELQARALVITGVEALDAVARVREMMSRLPMGADYEDLKAQIEAELTPWLVTSTDPEEQAKQRAAAYRRAEMLLRMHGWQAYARTQHSLMEAHTDAFPYRQYLSSEDSRVRPAHAALNRKILPADHPFWHNHTPPWEFGCRCDCVPLTQDEVDEIRRAESAKAPEDMEVLPAAQLQEIEDNGRMVKPGGLGFMDIRTPRERNGTGYEWNVKNDALSIDQILARYTPAVRQAFEVFASHQILEDGRSLLEWWQNGAATAAAIPAQVPAVPVVAVIPTVPAAPPLSYPQGKPVSSAITHHKRSTRKEKAFVQEMLDAIDHVHGDGTLLDMPVRWAKGDNGHYAPGREIKIGKHGLKYQQIVHEMGHKLDREGIPSAKTYASEDPKSAIAGAMDVIRASQAVTNLRALQLPFKHWKYKRYVLGDKELWARAYAQFIAEESGHPGILEEIQNIVTHGVSKTGYLAESHWQTADFAPIRIAIRDALTSLGWLTTPSTTPLP